MQKRLNEIREELTSIESRASELNESVETADENGLDEIRSEIEKMESRKAELVAEMAEIEARHQDAQAIENGKVQATQIEKPVERGDSKMEMTREELLASKEYRDAFYSMIAGTCTAEQRAVLKSPISVDGDGTNDGQAIALPKGLDEKIWDNIHTSHPVLADVAVIRSGIVMEVTKHTAMTARVSSKKDGATTAGAEENTFVKVTLAGKDYEKYVELTYAEAKMSQGALEDYLANEIGAELGEALAKDVFAQVLTDCGTAQKVTATSDLFADIKSALALANLGGRKVIYAPSASYYEIVGAIKSGSPFNIGATLGVEVKLDDAATKVTVLDPKAFVLNEVQAVMIETNRDIKSHRVIVSGYERAEGCLRINKAAAYIA